MRALLLVASLLVGCETSRTELMIGVATDLRAPDIIDGAELVVTRAKDGFVEQQVSWSISGIRNQPFNLPGTFGVYSDGEEVKLDIALTGLRGDTPVVTRRAVLNLIAGKTLFFRMGLTAGCIDKNDCTATQSCVEGACIEREVNSLQLPEFEAGLDGELTCAPAAQYIDTSTGEPMPLSDDAAECPPELCLEGVCLKPPPAQTEPRTVLGSKITTFIEPNAFTNVPTDLSNAAPSALIPDGAGGFTTIPGRGAADGTFAIDDVPPGVYYLKDGSDYYVTSSNTFDLGDVALGRPDTVAATATTSIAVNASNLSPFGDTDELEALSARANTWWFGLQSIEPIATNSTTLSDYTINTDFSFGSNLIMGDDFAVIHLASKQAVSGQPYVAATQVLRPSPFVQADGSTTTITGAFVDLAQSNTFRGDLRTSQWDETAGFDGTHLTALNPLATETSSGLGYFIHGQIGGTVYGRGVATADFVSGRVAHGADTVVDGVKFGYPFPVSEVWGTLFNAFVSGSVSYQLPGASTPARLPVAISVDQTLDSATGPIVPSLGPVRVPTIAELDLFQPQAGISETPTIAWQAPAIGSPTMYVVAFHELAVTGGATTRSSVGRLFTTATSVAVPPGIFTTGRSYAIQITATTIPNPTAPHRLRLPAGTSIVASAIITIGAPQGTAPECAACVSDLDCLRGTCSNGVCVAAPTTVMTSLGNMIPGYVREDGAILLAHYGAGTFNTSYDPALSQEVTTSGGAVPPPGWAPDPCRESGHLSFAEWDPAGRSVVIECGTGVDAVMGSFESQDLFSSFASGSYGTVGAGGTPGWGMIAAVGSGQGRSNHASCGDVTDTATGGIAYCDGPGAPNSFGNHLVSFFASVTPGNNFVGCMGMGCNGPTCPLQIWVWLK